MGEEEDGAPVFFRAKEVSLIGNCVMIRCNDEEDAVIALELFKDVLLGRRVVFEAPQHE